MIFDDHYADCAYWCPLCGDPRSVCDAYGQCDKLNDEDKTLIPLSMMKVGKKYMEAKTMTVEERAKLVMRGSRCGRVLTKDDLTALQEFIEQALRDQIEDCARLVDQAHLMSFSQLAKCIRALAAPIETKLDDNQPDDRFDLGGFDCNEKQED